MAKSLSITAQMPSGVYDVLWQLYKNGPTWDGDLVSKEARKWLMDAGYADRRQGWNFLTGDGVDIALGMGWDKTVRS
jgi:hypothetical protein